MCEVDLAHTAAADQLPQPDPRSASFPPSYSSPSKLSLHEVAVSLPVDAILQRWGTPRGPTCARRQRARARHRPARAGRVSANEWLRTAGTTEDLLRSWPLPKRLATRCQLAGSTLNFALETIQVQNAVAGVLLRSVPSGGPVSRPLCARRRASPSRVASRPLGTTSRCGKSRPLAFATNGAACGHLVDGRLSAGLDEPREHPAWHGGRPLSRERRRPRYSSQTPALDEARKHAPIVRRRLLSPSQSRRQRTPTGARLSRLDSLGLLGGQASAGRPARAFDQIPPARRSHPAGLVFQGAHAGRSRSRSLTRRRAFNEYIRSRGSLNRPTCELPTAARETDAFEAMADREDLEFTYSLIDRIFRLSLGELADFSGAKYDGDFSLSLEQAQRRKHDYVAEQIGIGPGRRVLDLGLRVGSAAGLRPRARRGIGVGVTLSSAQAAPAAGTGSTSTCYDARQVDARDLRRVRRRREPRRVRALLLARGVPRRTPGRDLPRLFARVAGVLPAGGRLYLQTMVFGRNMIPVDRGRHRRRARLRRLVPRADGAPVPGSWPPVRPRAGHPQRRAALSAGVEHQRAA